MNTNSEENARKIDLRERGTLQSVEDSSQIMSVDLFKEFTMPYDKILYKRFSSVIPDSRGMHMCGKSTHLHKTLVEDLKITSFNLFGYQVSPKVAAQNMGGKVLLFGNISPMLMMNGTKGDVKKAAIEALEAMAPCGGLMLGDGANVCPGTPLENLAALTEASWEYALEHPGFFVKTKDC